MSSISEILEKYKEYLTLTPNNRILCNVTKHEMPITNIQMVLDHLNSTKFKKAKEWYSYDFTKHLPYIIPHKSNDKKLFCTLTRHEINKIPETIEKHCNGKKFLRLKREFEEKQISKKLKRNIIEQQKEDEDLECWVPTHEVLREIDADVAQNDNNSDSNFDNNSLVDFLPRDDDDLNLPDSSDEFSFDDDDTSEIKSNLEKKAFKANKSSKVVSKLNKASAPLRKKKKFQKI